MGIRSVYHMCVIKVQIKCVSHVYSSKVHERKEMSTLSCMTTFYLYSFQRSLMSFDRSLVNPSSLLNKDVVIQEQ